jgi:hypothetical protein
VNFGFCLGKKPPGDVLILHKLKAPPQLAKLAKSSGETPKTVCGGLTLEEKLLTLTCVSEPISGLARRIRLFLKQVGLKYTIQVIGPDGALLEADSPEDEEETTGAEAEDDVGTGEEVAEGTATGGSANNDMDLQSEVAELRGEVIALGRARRQQLGKDTAARMSAGLKQATSLASSGDATAAIALLSALRDELEALPELEEEASPEVEDEGAQIGEEELKSARARVVALAEEKRGQLTGEERSTLSADLKRADAARQNGQPAEALQGYEDIRQRLAGLTAGRPVRLMPIWQETKEALDKQIGALQKALRNYNHPDLHQIADYGFLALTGGNHTRLMAALFNYDAQPSAKTATGVKTALDAFDALLASGSVLEDYDANPFGVSLRLGQTLRDGVSKLQAGLE